MDVRSVVGAVPARLTIGAEQSQASYELADDLVAAHGAKPSASAVMSFEGDDISVEPLSEGGSRDVEGAAVGPVYRQSPGGGLAVPSGRVFVRFGKGDTAEGHSDELADAGYRVEEVPSFAPHAAWLRPASGAVKDALEGLDRVRRLPAVEHAEPQLLTPAAKRG